jgi:phosphatidylglycerophosphate synthase
VISTLRTICALRGFALAARPSGKLKAIIQAAAALIILVMMIPNAMGHLSDDALQRYSSWLIGLAAGYSVFSGLDYIIANGHYVKKLLISPYTK